MNDNPDTFAYQIPRLKTHREFLIEEVRKELLAMTEDERIDFIQELRSGFCPDCGYQIKTACSCQNDD